MSPSIFSSSSSSPAGAVIQVAILCPLERDRRFIASMPEAFTTKRKCNFHFLDSGLTYANRDLTCSFDMCAYVQECVAYVEDNGIDAVLATRDVADLILAAMAQELKGKKKIMAPSITSAFLALHKIRTREMLDPDPIRFEAVDVDDLPYRKDLLSMFVKPSTGSCSQATCHLKQESDLHQASAMLKAELPQLAAFLEPFLRKYLPLEEQKEAKRLDCRSIAVAEEFVTPWLVVAVDGFVDSEGGIRPMIVIDSNLHKDHPTSFSDITVPSRLYKEKPSMIKKLEKAYFEIGKRLIKHGFHSMVLEIEFFVVTEPEERVILMEVNGRMSVQMTEVYRQVLGIDLYTLQTELCLGLRPLVPKFDYKKSCLIGTNVYVNIFIGDDEEGIRASDVIDFEEVDIIRSERDMMLEMKCGPKTKLTKSSNCGTTVGMFDLFSKISREDNLSRAIKAQKRFLKRPELAPWHPNFKYKYKK